MSARQAVVIPFTFAAGATVSTAPSGTAYADTRSVCFGGFYCTDEFNGDTLTFKTLIAGIAVTKMTKVAATGWNFFTQDELLAIGSSENISITTGSATAAAATIHLEMKS